MSSKPRVTRVPYRQWPLRARIIERLYRRTHGGRVRTLAVTEGWQWAGGRMTAYPRSNDPRNLEIREAPEGES